MKQLKEINKLRDLEITDEFKFANDRMENTQKNLFITGKAGTGKSTLLEYFKVRTSKSVVVLAPTGVSAVNIKGQTIHSFFRFKPDITKENVLKIKIRKNRRILYENLDAIIIDEVSMVRADLLDCIDAFLRMYGRYKGLPFGGVQMIFFGDLFQLPPVVTRHDREIFQGVYESPYFFDAKSFGSLKLEYIELSNIYRQTEKQFIDLLNSVRDKTSTYDNISLLNQRVKPGFAPQGGEFYVYLTSTNAAADIINQRHLDALKTRPYKFEGEVTGDFEKKNLPTHHVLNLKFGSQVMLLNNDVNGKWINGSIGKIKSVKCADGISDIIIVELENNNLVEVKPFTWEMFRFFFNEQSQAIESESVGSFRQYPLKLAWAITIHKSQGKTFSRVIVDIGNGTFAPGQVYVALSRCTNFEGLVLTRPIYKKHILLDERVIRFANSVKESISVPK